MPSPIFCNLLIASIICPMICFRGFELQSHEGQIISAKPRQTTDAWALLWTRGIAPFLSGLGGPCIRRCTLNSWLFEFRSLRLVFTLVGTHQPVTSTDPKHSNTYLRPSADFQQTARVRFAALKTKMIAVALAKGRIRSYGILGVFLHCVWSVSQSSSWGIDGNRASWHFLLVCRHSLSNVGLMLHCLLVWLNSFLVLVQTMNSTLNRSLKMKRKVRTFQKMSEFCLERFDSWTF